MLYSIVKHSALEKTALRYDPEYYKPDNIKYYSRLLDFGSLPIGDFAFVTDGTHESIEFDENSGILLVSAKSPKENYFDISRLGYISIKQHKANPRTTLREGDVVVSTVGTIGNCAVVTSEILPANSDRHVGIIRIDEKIRPYYLSTFLLSKYGRFQTLREATGNVQLNLFVYKIKEILVANASDKFQSGIERLCVSAHKQQIKSKTLHDDAVSLLLTEIGLADWRPGSQLFFIKNYSATQQANRIDAEYFRPKYDQIVAAIKGYAGGWDVLGNLADIKKSVEVGSGEYLGEGIPFVRVSNLSPFEITEEKYISGGLYAELKQHQPQRGEILFSKDATPGIAHYLREKPAKMIPSGGVLRLLPKSNLVNNDCLTLILNSLLVQEQINRDCGGSVILHWRPEQVKETLIPILPEKVQAKIQQKSAESHNLHKQSKRLLDCARQAVEIAIEKGEKKALRWIEREAV